MTRMVAFGDSILEGWDGHEDIAHDQRIPELIGKINGWDVTNTAVGGTQFSGANSFESKTARMNFHTYDIVLVGFGVNDWCYPQSLAVEKEAIQEGISHIRTTNARIPILFELPTQDFRNGSTSLDDKNSAGFSQNQLCDLIIQVAKANGCKYYDWRTDPLITPANRMKTLGDNQVHPTKEVMRKMAERLAPVLAGMVPSSTKPTTPTNPSSPSNPSNPSNQPSKPVAEINCKLIEADDLFKLGDNLNKNVATAVDFINGIYKRIDSLFGTDLKTISYKVTYSNGLSRPLRNGVIRSLLELQSLVNDLIKCCNGLGIVDPLIGDTDTITINPPRTLTVDSRSYQSQLNAQWKLINDALNKISHFLTKMGV